MTERTCRICGRTEKELSDCFIAPGEPAQIGYDDTCTVCWGFRQDYHTIILIGPPGCGKNLLVQSILEKFPKRSWTMARAADLDLTAHYYGFFKTKFRVRWVDEVTDNDQLLKVIAFHKGYCSTNEAATLIITSQANLSHATIPVIRINSD